MIQGRKSNKKETGICDFEIWVNMRKKPKYGGVIVA